MKPSNTMDARMTHVPNELVLFLSLGNRQILDNLQTSPGIFQSEVNIYIFVLFDVPLLKTDVSSSRRAFKTFDTLKWWTGQSPAQRVRQLAQSFQEARMYQCSTWQWTASNIQLVVTTHYEGHLLRISTHLDWCSEEKTLSLGIYIMYGTIQSNYICSATDKVLDCV